MKPNRFLLPLLLLISCGEKTESATTIIEPTEKSVVISFTGDTFTGRRFEPLLQNGFDPFDAVREVFLNDDLTVVNLEGCAIEAGTEIGKTVHLQMPPETLSLLTNAGIDGVNIANNHAIDFCADGLLTMLSNLDAYGIPYFGAGKDEFDANAPLFMERNGLTIGFLAQGEIDDVIRLYAGTDTAGIAKMDLESLLSSISNARPLCDVLTVSIHTGWEYSTLILEHQKERAHAAIDAGADAVIMHGSHVLQGVEIYKDKFIFYNIGNFIFDQKRAATRKTGIFSLNFCVSNEALTSRAFFIPLQRNETNFAPFAPDEDELSEINDLLIELSENEIDLIFSKTNGGFAEFEITEAQDDDG